MLFINGSYREKNCFAILNDLKRNEDELISLSKKDIKFCLGCNCCINKLDKYCVQDDYITNEVYKKIIGNDKIILASPLYISNISGTLKTLIDRFNPLYNHNLLVDKKIFLVLTGQGSEEDNKTEIEAIINYFNGISEWLGFEFTFFKYFTSGDINEVDDVKIENKEYNSMIDSIRKILDKNN